MPGNPFDMKILHVIASLDPATGGPPMVAVRLAAAQAALGCETHVSAYRFPGAEERIEASLKTIPNFALVRFDALPVLTRTERLLPSGARRILSSAISQFDLIHLHGVWETLIKAAAAIARKAGKPYVITPHGMLDPWAMRQKRLKKRVALSLGYRKMLSGAAFLHYLNADESALAAPLGLTAPSRVIANGIFLEELDPLPPRGKFRDAHSAVSTSRIILFLSRLHYKKGLDYLADAFVIVARRVPDAVLVVAGPDDGAKAAFEAQIARLGIAHRVHIVGPLYGAQKIAALRDCDCFCLPSRQEGFSLAVTEAMACLAPVVISRDCHFPEVAEVKAGFVTELNPLMIADCIEKVISHPQSAAEMGEAGRKLVISRFTWPIVAGAMLAGYREVTGTS
jgi:glycosyltransferase involved in cell wall biosynthesis